MIDLFIYWKNELTQIQDPSPNIKISDLLAVSLSHEKINFIQWQRKNINESAVLVTNYWSLSNVCFDLRLTLLENTKVELSQSLFLSNTNLPSLDNSNWRQKLEFFPSQNPDPCIKDNYFSAWVNIVKKKLISIDPDQEIGAEKRLLRELLFEEKPQVFAQFERTKLVPEGNNCIMSRAAKDKIPLKIKKPPQGVPQSGTGLFVKFELRSIVIESQ